MNEGSGHYLLLLNNESRNNMNEVLFVIYLSSNLMFIQKSKASL